MIGINRNILTLILTIGLFSCGRDDSSSNNVNTDHLIIQDVLTNPVISQSEFIYKGGTIELKEELGSNETYLIQEITKQKEDIKYRVKRIPSQLYLENQGVSGEALKDALDEVKGEQLFYFEFEENQKQDLIKKHLGNDLDGNIAYLSFEIGNDFKLITQNGDTISSAYSLYERNFHVAPYERLLVSFSGVDSNEEVQLFYRDKLFGNGELNFAFASSAYLENNIKNPS